MTTYQEVAPHAFPYLVMMGLRILELHRVLKPTGSFYLHCDPTMSHYLKTICDIIFSTKNFRNEKVWRRKGGSALKDMRQFSNAFDILLYYTNSDNYLFKQINIMPDDNYIQKNFNRIDENGRRFQATVMRSPNPRPNLMYNYKGYKMTPNGWAVSKEKMEEMDKQGLLYFPKEKTKQIYKKLYLDEYVGQSANNLWTDISTLKETSSELLGYPTQKPKALLERIIEASSNKGDVILDAFCGCGTSIDAAEALHRKWIGIDISPIAISLIKRRLKDFYKTSLSKFEVCGVPEDEPSAIRLWNENPFAFKDWWLTEFEVFSTTECTKGADKGIDGIGQYLVGENQNIRVAFQVKVGKVQSKDIDALIGVLSKHKCDLGIFLTIEQPTKPMLETATGEGLVKYEGFQYPKIQIHTLKDFFANKRPKLPATNITFKAAQFKGKKSKQIDLGI